MNEQLNVQLLKEKLKRLGAKTSGNKAELIKRLDIWTNTNLNKTLFNVEVVPADCLLSFPDNLNFEVLANLQNVNLDWFSTPIINQGFSDRLAVASENRGRALCFHNFLKNICFRWENTIFYVKSKCSAEKKKSVDYDVKIILCSEKRCIMMASCQCPAGFGQNAACKHVSALAYAIEFYALTGTIKQNEICTSQLQVWHKPKPGRSLEKLSVDDMLNISSPNDTITNCDKNTIGNYLINSYINLNQCSSLMPQRNCNVSGYLNDHNYTKDKLSFLILNEINKVTVEESMKIEKKTRKTNNLWFNIRKSRITASIVSNITSTCRSRKYVTSFLNNHVAKKKIKSAALSWGVTNENKALQTYCKITGETFAKCGIFIDKTRKYLSATPDGINGDKTLIIEIKCPYSIKNEDPSKAPYLVNGKLSHKHAYFIQVQIQMHVTGIKKCDFVVWTTKGIYIEGINYDEYAFPEVNTIVL